MSLYRIGDFSLIVRLSVKTIRYYDEVGILKPARVDAETGYRWYDDACVEQARVVRTLREFEFSTEQIAQLLPTARSDEDIRDALARKARDLAELSQIYENKARQIERALELAADPVGASSFIPQFLNSPRLRIAELRYHGRYSDVGEYFSRLYRALGRFIRGRPFCLYRQMDYADETDISACAELGDAPINEAALNSVGIAITPLPSVEGMETVHVGPYERLGSTYAKLFAFAEASGKRPIPPIREIYEKGPGLVFRGDSSRYRTRIFVPLEGI